MRNHLSKSDVFVKLIALLISQKKFHNTKSSRSRNYYYTFM